MKTAICSLSELTYVAEYIDPAQRLNEHHEVCFFLGFSCQYSLQLIQQRNVSYQVTLEGHQDIKSVLKGPAAGNSVYEIIAGYFLKHAELMLPSLVNALRAWKPDLVLSFFRDYAGMTAAEILNIPLISFGSAGSLARIEGENPPYGSGVSRDAPKRFFAINVESSSRTQL